MPLAIWEVKNLRVEADGSWTMMDERFSRFVVPEIGGIHDIQVHGVHAGHKKPHAPRGKREFDALMPLDFKLVHDHRSGRLVDYRGFQKRRISSRNFLCVLGWKRSSESAAFAPRRARLFLGKSAVEGARRDDEQVASSQRPFRSLRCLGELRIGVPPRGENG